MTNGQKILWFIVILWLAVLTILITGTRETVGEMQQTHEIILTQKV